MPPIRRVPSVAVREVEAGRRLDQWLAERFTYHDLRAWRAELDDRRVLVNGHPQTPAYCLQLNDEVEYHPPDLPEPPVTASYEILAEEDDFLVINKPADLPCHPAGRYFKHTLWYLLKKPYGKVHMVNRLDRETSGLMLVTRTKYAARKFGKQFERRQVEKEYLCLVEGEFPATLQADGVLVPDDDSRIIKKRRFTVNGEGESAVTDFEALGSAGGLSLVRCRPETGRMHQIRVTLCSLGYPVVGDKVYGMDEQCYLKFIAGEMTENDWTRLRLPNQALHAWKLRCRDPRNQAREFVAPVPPRIAGLLRDVGIPIPSSG